MSHRTLRTASVTPWVAVAGALFYSLHDPLEVVKTGPVVALGAALAMTGVILRWRDVRLAPADANGEARIVAMRAAKAASVLFAASIGIALLHTFLFPQNDQRQYLIANLVPLTMGWSSFLLLPIAMRTSEGGGLPRLRSPLRALVGVLVVAIVLVAVYVRTVEHWTYIDEVLYTLQANLFARGEMIWRMDPAARRFLTLPLMAVRADGVYPQYPPGYPLLLSVFVRLGVLALSGPMLAGIVIVATYVMGRRLASPFVGLAAAAILASHVLFVRWSGVYMSHLGAMAAITPAALLLLTNRDASSRRRSAEALLAGVFLGVAVAIRPVTGFALSLTLWLWLLARRPVRWPGLLRTTLLMAVGALPAIAALMLYNDATTGSPIRFGYQAAVGHLNDLGFGMRGLVLYDANALRVVSAQPFTPMDAMRNEAGQVWWQLSRDALPFWTALPLLAAAFAYRLRVNWRTLAAFAVLPIVDFFYLFNDERLYLELLPFVAIGAALVVARVWESDAKAGRALLIFLVGANLVADVSRIAQLHRDAPVGPSAVLSSELRERQRQAGPLLVFVKNPPLSEPLFIALSRFNFGPFPGDIVVARDLGDENARLLCRFPDHAVLVAEFMTPEHGTRLRQPPADSTRRESCGSQPPPVSPPSPR
jgi:hypothetical protein